MDLVAYMFHGILKDAMDLVAYSKMLNDSKKYDDVQLLDLTVQEMDLHNGASRQVCDMKFWRPWAII